MRSATRARWAAAAARKGALSGQPDNDKINKMKITRRQLSSIAWEGATAASQPTRQDGHPHMGCAPGGATCVRNTMLTCTEDARGAGLQDADGLAAREAVSMRFTYISWGAGQDGRAGGAHSRARRVCALFLFRTHARGHDRWGSYV